jgi:hypothetical protein
MTSHLFLNEDSTVYDAISEESQNISLKAVKTTEDLSMLWDTEENIILPGYHKKTPSSEIDEPHDHDIHGHDHASLLDVNTNKIHSEENKSVSGLDMLTELRLLQSKWTYYYHLPNDKNWNLASYKIIMSEIDNLEHLIGINEYVSDNVIKNCMLFVMRTGITPMWEDAQNRNGGCFSYKVTNKVVTQIWRKLMYLMCSYSLTVDVAHMDLVNGITISPKKGFCIIKIWMKNCTLQDPAVIVNIENLVRNGCLFKSHSPEF